MRTTRKIFLLLALATASTTACRTSSPWEAENAEPGYVTLDVRNEHLLSMDVYAVSNGLATRVGRVQGMNKATFTLNPTLYVSSDFRIVATPASGNGRASTGTLQVHSGQTVEFTITNRLASSRVSIREPDRTEVVSVRQ
jgi:hypothetical protein